MSENDNSDRDLPEKRLKTGLQPQALGMDAGTAQNVKRILEESLAPNTRQAHDKDLAYFEAWHKARLGELPVYPIEWNSVIMFISDHRGGMPEPVDQALVDSGVKAKPGTHSVATVSRRVGTLSKYHQMQDFTPNPCADPRVRSFLSGVRKEAARKHEQPRKKRAATLDVLEQLLQACRRDETKKAGKKIAALRDQALFLFAFRAGGRRRSEVAGARWEDFVPLEGGYLFRLGRSKTDQEGKGKDYPVMGKAAQALDRWKRVCGLSEGPVFRALHRSGRILGPLTPQSVNFILKKRASQAGLPASEFGAHSFRSGFVTETGRQGISLGDTMALSGHKSMTVALSYYQAGAVTRNPAAWVGEEREQNDRKKTTEQIEEVKRHAKNLIKSTLAPYPHYSADAKDIVTLYSAILKENDVAYRTMRGELAVRGVVFDGHWWIEFAEFGWVLDTSLKLLVEEGENVPLPDGVFNPDEWPGIRHEGEAVKIYPSRVELEVLKKRFEPFRPPKGG